MLEVQFKWFGEGVAKFRKLGFGTFRDPEEAPEIDRPMFLAPQTQGISGHAIFFMKLVDMLFLVRSMI